MSVRPVLAMLVAVGALWPPVGAQGTPVPGTHCRLFPTNEHWNSRVDALPVDSASDEWLRTMGAAQVHPDSGKADCAS